MRWILGVGARPPSSGVMPFPHRLLKVLSDVAFSYILLCGQTWNVQGGHRSGVCCWAASRLLLLVTSLLCCYKQMPRAEHFIWESGLFGLVSFYVIPLVAVIQARANHSSEQAALSHACTSNPCGYITSSLSHRLNSPHGIL